MWKNHVTAKYICPKICIGVSTGNINGMEDLKPVFLIILRQAFYYKFIVLRQSMKEVTEVTSGLFVGLIQRIFVHTFQVEMGFPQERYDMGTHIWYYNPDGSSWHGVDDIPMRVAITFYRPDKVEKEAFRLLQQQIYEILWEVLDNRG